MTTATLAACVIAVLAPSLLPVQAEAGTRALGIDVSRFQKTIDWPSGAQTAS